MIIFIGLLLLILHISIIILVQAYSQQVCTPDEPSFCFQVDGQQRRGNTHTHTRSFFLQPLKQDTPKKTKNHDPLMIHNSWKINILGVS